jgi:hypothetical protein
MKNLKCPTCGKFVGKNEVYCKPDMDLLIAMYEARNFGETIRPAALSSSKKPPRGKGKG